jgi:hypothetical protein
MEDIKKTCGNRAHYDRTSVMLNWSHCIAKVPMWVWGGEDSQQPCSRVWKSTEASDCDLWEMHDDVR